MSLCGITALMLHLKTAITTIIMHLFFFFWNILEKVLKLANQSYPCANVITFFNTGTSPTCDVPLNLK